MGVTVALYGSFNESPTGPSEVTAGVAHGVAEAGFEVEVVTNGDRTGHPHPAVTVTNLPGRPDSVRGFLRAKRRAAAYVEEGSFDLFHSLAGTMSAADVLTCQGIFSDIDFLRWCPSVVESPRTFVGANVYSVLKTAGILRSSVLVATSPFVGRQLRTYLRTAPDEVVPLGVRDRDREPPSSTATPTRVLLPGRVEPRKGQDRVLDHLSPAAEDYRVDVVGGIADAEYSAGFADGWGDSIHGHVPRERLDEFYRRADVAVVPSRHETFAITALEAISKGCALVITDRCGFATFEAANRENGVFVVESGAEAARAVETLATDDRLPAHERAAYDLSGRFTWERIGREYGRVYDRLEG